MPSETIEAEQAVEPCRCGSSDHDESTCEAIFCDAYHYDWRSHTTKYGHWLQPDDPNFEDGLCDLCGHCNEHCECVECEGWRCHERFSDSSELCGECACCNSCCECQFCERCGDNTYGNYCSECYCCDSGCCECNNDMELDEYEVGTPQFHTPHDFQLQRNKSTRHAALEIELSNCAEDGYRQLRNTDEVLYRWHARRVHDGSISGGNIDAEINTAPAAGDLLVDQISDITEALYKDGATANRSCGVHVHVDCRDHTFYDMRRLVILYEKIEPALFEMMPEHRRDNDYCRECGSSYSYALRRGQLPADEEGTKKALVNNLYECGTEDYAVNRAIRSAKGEKYNDARYNALNLHSWIYRGTVECRLMYGTVSRRNLTNWALLWVAIVDFAHDHTEAEIEALDGEGIDILRFIAPNAEVNQWIRSQTAKFAEPEPPLIYNGYNRDAYYARQNEANDDARDLRNEFEPAGVQLPLAA